MTSDQVSRLSAAADALEALASGSSERQQAAQQRSADAESHLARIEAAVQQLNAEDADSRQRE